MKTVRHKNFKKQYKKLLQPLKTKVDLALKKFVTNPFDETLKNHALKGKMYGKRAFSITGDIRIVFEEYDDYVVVIVLAVGSHNQIYWKVELRPITHLPKVAFLAILWYNIISDKYINNYFLTS